ncbi:nucleoside triphosphate pyrophosphohydrolase [Thermochromatium tepidum]|jgi:MazG family protein|uniref:Nucleoside triphosphate pyrophosphohydrolase n=1 Tax=Thermochromatium tepidum ATCC 43061 TaxID=316276 RepID=A0A6I6E2I9_THETI|nr:nucleoside triphosphate pyrophosphohydrolase [Thermochromatium tepidum]QGU31922.1 nucleoside triphosphate pyrophosphohydrolase [Thermochromatium tepidum ATCC 43061]
MTDTPPIDRLIAIMARLRDPENGCPWDLEQTFRTILPYTLEEAYEVAEAVEREDMTALRDELGDLLLQVVFHARLAEEGGHFAFADVVESVCAKLIRRHPHVFGTLELADAATVLDHWERLKAAERAQTRVDEPGALAGVARTLPALVRAEKLQRRAARVGFDWDEPLAVLAKVEEELAECRATLTDQATPSERIHEIGDLLFACVNLARHLGVEAEQALRAANRRFEQRFAQVERGLREQGLEPSPETRDEMERQWTLAKATERRG